MKCSILVWSFNCRHYRSLHNYATTPDKIRYVNLAIDFRPSNMLTSFIYAFQRQNTVNLCKFRKHLIVLFIFNAKCKPSCKKYVEFFESLSIFMAKDKKTSVCLHDYAKTSTSFHKCFNKCLLIHITLLLDRRQK